MHIAWLFAISGLMLAGLVAIKPEVQVIAPAEAEKHEGQTVRLEGVVRDARIWQSGARLTVGLDGHGVSVDVDEWNGTLGSWVVAEGRLLRYGGELRLQADIITLSVPDAQHIPLAVLTATPEAHDAVTIRGEVDKGWLIADHHRIRLGAGPWQQGAVQATGAASFDERCACYRFHAAAVEPWIS